MAVPSLVKFFNSDKARASIARLSARFEIRQKVLRYACAILVQGLHTDGLSPSGIISLCQPFQAQYRKGGKSGCGQAIRGNIQTFAAR